MRKKAGPGVKQKKKKKDSKNTQMNSVYNIIYYFSSVRTALCTVGEIRVWTNFPLCTCFKTKKKKKKMDHCEDVLNHHSHSVERSEAENRN